MPRQGGQGKGKPKLRDRNFGKALIKRTITGFEDRKSESKQLISILDNSTLDDYVLATEMDGREAEVKRVNQNDAFLVEPTTSQTIQALSSAQFDYKHLRIPRKPSWNSAMTADEVDRREKDAFLEWRREIASMEVANQSFRVTPFEKNLEVWRQLWRVLERSDFAIQIVDARNPLMYFTGDLMKYAAEHEPKRPMMLLINKADFLTDYQRRVWANYFDNMGIKFAFYSAQLEKEKIDAAATHTLASQLDSIALAAEAEDVALLSGPSSGTAPLPRAIEPRRSGNGIVDEEIEALADDMATDWERTYIAQGRAGQKNQGELGDEVTAAGTVSARHMNGIASVAGFAVIPEDGEEEIDDDVEEGNGDPQHPETIRRSMPKQGAISAAAAATPAAATPAVGSSSVQSRRYNAASSRLEQVERERLRAAVLTREQLILLLSMLPGKLGLTAQSRHGDRICVGMLGYPNVGKSSVINTILGVSKSSHGVVRVAVSSTPGKTKHFQTLMVSDSLMLCDCPGLVFPSFMRSTGEMLCAGILPVNQMRDYESPASVIASRVPLAMLEAAYGMHIRRVLDIKDNPDRPPTCHEMLCAYCAVKGYITNGTGRWDEFRACKELLRDFNDGRILFVAPPADSEEEMRVVDLRRWQAETEKTMMRQERVAERIAIQKLREIEEEAEEEEKAAQLLSTGKGGALATVGGGGGACVGEMVFGGGPKNWAGYEENGIVYELGDDSSEDEGDEDEGCSVVSSSVAGGTIDGKAASREHKRLKHWGKKNKKLRNKNPYGEDDVSSFVAYTTNRARVGVVKSEEEKARRRHDPRQAFGTQFVRPVLPHHITKDDCSVP